MDSLVKSRPNHYELLGLTPAATDEDIRRAFAREISPLRPRPFGSLAQLGVAHETLRDPVKRRAYDISIGLPEPAQPAPLAGWQYSGPVRVSRLSQAAADSQVATEPKADVQEEIEPAADAPQQAFVAEDLSTAEPELHVEPKPGLRPDIDPDRGPEPQPDWNPARPAPMQQRLLPLEEDGSGEWKRPLMIGGAIFLAVGIMGVIAGVWASKDVESKVPASPPLIEAPAEAHPVTSTLPPAADPATQQQPAQPARTAAPKASRASPEVKRVPAVAERAEDVPEIPSEKVAAIVAPPDETPASMPLSNATVARTIGRIGYSCGEVTSTSTVDGQPGVFKVTCTSGQSYKAAPVRGRYRFSRWAGR